MQSKFVKRVPYQKYTVEITMKKRLQERILILNTRKNTSIQETRVFIQFRTLLTQGRRHDF